MTDRPFPPSPRRRALAHRAGLVAASPVVVGGLACAAVAVAVVVAAHLTTMLGEAIAAACDGHATLSMSAAPQAVLALATPIVGAAAIAAAIGHLAQTRSLWLPRRRIDGAPTLDRGSAARTRGAAFDLAATLAIGGVAFAWLWFTAPRFATLLELSPVEMLVNTGALVASLLAAVATGWLVVGVVDALARHAALTRALAMTAAEKREDDRLAAADPRWRALRRGPSISDTVAGAALVLLGDDVAVAIAWDPVRRPIPLRVAIGQRAHATQLLGLARRHRIAVHRDPSLTASLADHEGPVPERAWARLAEIIAATRQTRPVK